ncbi:NAD-dependent epimerase/dehydratase family protein [Octadecabacter sp.]|nr:NAD-dependent epimerase/dehydratase family protein [Octadecabacter sp.]
MSNTICLTGHTGYIGSHFLQFLIRRGHSPFLIGRKGIQTKSVPGCKEAKLWNSISDLKIQLFDLENPIIINIAGLFASDHKLANYSQLIDANFSYSLSIMEAISDLPRARIVNIGSSWEYNDFGKSAPQNLYAQLKACNSSVAQWYAINHDIRTINLKLNDTFGGNDHRAKLMPLLKNHYLSGTTAQLRFSAQLINLLHISDVCEGLLSAANRTSTLPPNTCETAFLYAKDTLKLSELVNLINTLSSSVLRVKFHTEYPSEHRLRGVWNEAPLLQGWQPKLELIHSLEDYFIGAEK